MKSRAQGFTLIELMIVVAIVGVLAAVAVPTFNRYLMRSRTAEATTFLAEIKQRQESYRSEFGEYANVATANPTAVPGRNRAAWVAANTDWSQLGARPDEANVRFQYVAPAGPPGTTPPGISGYDGSDFWFVGRAVGDLDGDGRQVTFEVYSAANHIWCSEGANGWE